MTDAVATATEVPAVSGGHLGAVRAPWAALASLVSTTPATFAAQHWGRTPLLSRSGDLPARPGVLFDAAAVDELVARRALRTPFLRVAKDGRTLPDADFTLGGGLGATVADQVSEDKLLRLFAGGSTLVLQGLHRTWPPVRAFAQQLAGELGHPVQVNAYVTPPQSTGFSAHYDVHDVFVLQVEGAKRWQVHEPVLTLPLRDQGWEQRRDAVAEAAAGEPLLSAELAAGDVLYLPRGHLHSATALAGVSIHLTFGVHAWTRAHLATELTDAAARVLADEPDVRASLSLGTPLAEADLGPEVDRVRAALHAAVDAVSVHDIAASMQRRLRAAQRAEPMDPLAQLAGADAAGRDGMRWRLRAHLAASWDESVQPAVLVTRAGRRLVPAEDRAAVEAVLAGEPVDPEAMSADLLRRLVLAGIVVPDRPDLT